MAGGVAQGRGVPDCSRNRRGGVCDGEKRRKGEQKGRGLTVEAGRPLRGNGKQRALKPLQGFLKGNKTELQRMPNL